MWLVTYVNCPAWEYCILALWHRDITSITCCFPYILIVFLSSPNIFLCLFFFTKPFQVICICCYSFSYSPKEIFPTLLSHSICFIFPPFWTMFAAKGLLSTEHDWFRVINMPDVLQKNKIDGFLPWGIYIAKITLFSSLILLFFCQDWQHHLNPFSSGLQGNL